MKRTAKKAPKPLDLPATVRAIRAVLDQAVAARAAHDWDDEDHDGRPQALPSIEILAVCAPGEPEIYSGTLCTMEALVAILDAVAPVGLVREG